MNVTLVDSMGSDLSVVNAARVSFHKESQEFQDRDEKLINYLASHGHITPFMHVQYSVRIKMPIFVARQWFKSTVGIARNEVSRRYVDTPPEFYYPDEWRGRPVNKKQGSSDEIIDIREGKTIIDPYTRLMQSAQWTYEYMIRQGVCPEQARMCLPQSMFTEVIETGSIMAAARICKLRIHEDAQQEIEELALKFQAAVSDIAPVSWAALMR